MIEVTPKMIQAGYEVAREHPLGGDLRDMVESVFRQMLLEAEETKIFVQADTADAALAKVVAREGVLPISARTRIEHKDGVGDVRVIEWRMPSGRVAVWEEWTKTKRGST